MNNITTWRSIEVDGFQTGLASELSCNQSGDHPDSFGLRVRISRNSAARSMILLLYVYGA